MEQKDYFNYNISLWLVVLIGWLILLYRIFPHFFHCWLNISVILLQVIMKQQNILFITWQKLGIKFMSVKRSSLEYFLHFPVPKTVLSMSKTNWDPQDNSVSSILC
jgi:hypothetical protein